MSRRLLAVNVILVVIILAAGAHIARALTAAPSLPRPAPGARAPSGAPAGAAAPRRADDGAAVARVEMRPTYNVIPAKNLFSASRTETAGSAPIAAAPPPKLYLHGVVVDAAKSRAFIEDAAAKTTFSYAVGDAVGGGKLQVVKADRVVIARPEGPMEVMLRDASKPQPPPAAAGTPGAPPGAPRPGAVVPRPTGLPGPGSATPPPAPQTPGPVGATPETSAPAPVVGPRLMRPDLLRGPAGARPAPQPSPQPSQSDQ